MSAIWMFLSLGPSLTNNGMDFLKYFTAQSNFIVGLAALVHLLIYGVVKYDWYLFGANGLGVGVAIFLGALAGGFGVCLGMLALQNLWVAKRNR